LNLLIEGNNMQLKFVGEYPNYYFVKRILNHDEELTIGHLRLDAIEPYSLNYLQWNPLDSFSLLPKDEQEQIIQFISAQDSEAFTLEFID